MPGTVFGRVADIEHVECALTGLALPQSEGGPVDGRDAIAPGDRLGALPGRGDPLSRDLRRAIGRTIDHIEPGEMPGHRAVL